MRKYINCKSKVQDIGTHFYSATYDQVKDALNTYDTNLFVLYAFEKDGWDAIYMSKLFGSDIIDDILYICVTDGKDIYVQGESVDPEAALSEFDITELQDYIEPADDEIIRQHITSYEIRINDIELIAINMLEDGISLNRLIENYNDL